MISYEVESETLLALVENGPSNLHKEQTMDDNEGIVAKKVNYSKTQSNKCKSREITLVKPQVRSKTIGTEQPKLRDKERD